LVAGRDIFHITSPTAGPTPRRHSTGKFIAVSAVLLVTMALGAVLSAQLGWGSTDQDGGTGYGSQDPQGVSPTTGTDPSEGDDTDVQPTVSGPESTGASGTAAVRYSGPIRLTAIDLDANPPTVQSSDTVLFGNGFLVVYPQLNAQGAMAYGSSGNLMNSSPALAPYTRSDTPGRKDCVDLLRTQATEMLPVEEGSHLCVKTANGRIAFITAGTFTNGAFTGTAIIWDAIG
jgi:hypothetical protein